MIDNRMISSKAIIAKVIADLELKEPDIRITDIKEKKILYSKLYLRQEPFNSTIIKQLFYLL